MKWPVLLLALLPLTSYAQADGCREALDDAKTMCESAQNACINVRECLIRRDTCVSGIPKNEDDCTQLNDCMQEYKEEFEGVSRCDYVWYESDTSRNCSPKKHFLFIEDGCPGRIHGLLNAAAWGLNATVDSEFNCSAVVKQREKKVEACQRQLAQVDRACGALPDNMAYLKQYSCSEAENFARFTPGQWSIAPGSPSNRVNDRNRESSPGHRPSEQGTRRNSNSSSR